MAGSDPAMKERDKLTAPKLKLGRDAVTWNGEVVEVPSLSGY